MTATGDDTPDSLLVRAGRATDQGRVDEAMGLYRALLDDDPTHGVARNNLGCLLLEGGFDADAVEVLDVEEIRDAPPELENNRGYALLRTGELRRAERVFRALLEATPDDGDARNHLGMALLRRDRTAEARGEFERVVRENPNNVPAWNNLGCSRQKEGDLAGAEIAFRRALHVDPYSVDSHNNMGCVLREIGRFDEAVDELTVAVELEPRNATVHLNLALTYRKLENSRKALSHLRQHLRMGSASTELAELHLILQELEQKES